MKKTWSTVMAAVMAGSLLAGCQRTEGSGDYSYSIG